MPISKTELENMAIDFRHDAGVLDDQSPFDPLNLEIEGIRILGIDEIQGLDKKVVEYLLGDGVSHWSAMTVPLDSKHESWAIVLNSGHKEERCRPSLMEELWHIFLGHKLTKITKVGHQYGRAFDSDSEHDAFYAGAATLVPYAAILAFVNDANRDVNAFAAQFGVSRELVEYRIKRLGLWRKYVGHGVRLRSVTLRS